MACFMMIFRVEPGPPRARARAGSRRGSIARQRELYGAHLPFAEKWRTAMRYLVGDDVTTEDLA